MIPRGAGPDAVLVAIDGGDGAGKTCFATELAAILKADGRQVLRASVDDFHHPRAVRYRRGVDSAEGYWLDAFDYAALRVNLLDPLSPGGTRRYRPAVHQLKSDRSLEPDWLTAPDGAVLLLDGVFLHRDELDNCWSYSVFLDVDPSVRVARMTERDGHQPRMHRYLDAQRHYVSTCTPTSRASVVIDNNDLFQPVISMSR